MSSMQSGQSGGRCFMHPNTEAVAACANCGSFVCSVCAINHEGRIICPKCFSGILKKPDAGEVSGQRNLGVWSLIMFALALGFTIVDMFVIPENSSDTVFTIMGWGMLLPGIVGFIIGIVGITKKSTKFRAICVVGLVLNVLMLIFVFFLMVLGMSLGY
jgi:uncharacterized paraquat-inducible protein A